MDAALGPAGGLCHVPGLRDFLRGARGSLKTDGSLGDWISHADLYGENANGLMVRRNRVQLAETFERAKRVLVPLGFHVSGHTIISPQGARLTFAYLERDADAENYQGHSYTRIYVEELGNFPNPAPVMKLMATLRSAFGVPCGFRGTGNPGGPGHGWVKKRYIDAGARGWKVIESEFVNPWTSEKVIKQRIFIPGKITDHNLLGPEYIANLQMSGSPELVRAWLEGDWDVIAGAYFPEFSRGRHVLEPTEFPGDWRRFTATDWGSARPFWTGWFVVVQKEMRARTATGAPVTLLPGALVCYREWYGEDPKRPGRNLGLKLPVEEWAAGVLKRSRGEEIATTWSTPRCSTRMAGRRSPSAREGQAERQEAAPAQGGQAAPAGLEPGALPAARRRAGHEGRRRCSSSLMGCPDAIRTLAALQHDDVESKFEDADTDGEDHPPDGHPLRLHVAAAQAARPGDRFAGQPKKGTMEWLTTEAWKGQKMPGLSRRPLG
jgi:hypothetical protein